MGTLHERHRSLWIETSAGTDHPSLAGDTTADVVVVGAGIAGLTTARLLAEDGASVVVIDAGPICAGATGYTTAKLTSLHGRNYAQLADRFDADVARVYGEANEAAIGIVERLVAQDAIECGFERRPHVAYATSAAGAEDLRREGEVARRLGLPATDDTATELPFPVTGALRFDGQAQFHPRAYCLALADAVAARGGRIHEHTRALHVDGGASVVATDRGEVRAGAIVVTTHLPFKELGGYFARAEPSRSYACAVTVEGPRPEAMYISVDEPTRSLRTAGEHLIVGGEGHKVGDHHDTTVHYEALESWAREHFEGMAVAHRWSAQDWAPADGIPFIGRMAGEPDHVYVATGFKKWGMSNGTVAAAIISDLIAGRSNPWAEVFDARRIAPKQNLRKVVAENVEVVKHFVGDRIASRNPPPADELAPGQGAVVELDGEKVAAFRDDDGALHAVSAVCTHLGCLVSFNTAERTWDCPCHGSRFNVDGCVLEGPAVDDLQLKQA